LIENNQTAGGTALRNKRGKPQHNAQDIPRNHGDAIVMQSKKEKGWKGPEKASPKKKISRSNEGIPLHDPSTPNHKKSGDQNEINNGGEGLGVLQETKWGHNVGNRNCFQWNGGRRGEAEAKIKDTENGTG